MGVEGETLAEPLEQPLATAAISTRLTIRNYLYKLSLMKDLDAAFFALADPTRRAILARLARGEATVMELAAPFAMSQPAISQHLKVLEKAKLIARRVEGTKRLGYLREEGLRPIEDWVSEQRAIWEGRLDRMESYVGQLKKKEQKSGKRK